MALMLIEQDAVTEPIDAGHTCRPQRVLIVDDNELLVAGLRSVLVDKPWIAACLGTGSAADGLEIARRRQPHIILVSTSVSGQSGLEFCRRARAAAPLAKVVLMSNQGTVPTSLARAHGAVGFVPQWLPVSAIVSAVKLVAEGARVFPGKPTHERTSALSRRELDVLQHLVRGLSNPEVAALLNLSRHTVKQHTSVVYRKLGVRNRAEAASRARELGLVA